MAETKTSRIVSYNTGLVKTTSSQERPRTRSGRNDLVPIRWDQAEGTSTRVPPSWRLASSTESAAFAVDSRTTSSGSMKI